MNLFGKPCMRIKFETKYLSNKMPLPQSLDKEGRAHIVATRYDLNQRICLLAYDTKMIILMKITANLPLHHVKRNHVAIKDYSENEGVLNCLIVAEVVYPPTTYITQRYARYPVCKLTDKAIKELGLDEEEKEEESINRYLWEKEDQSAGE